MRILLPIILAIFMLLPHSVLAAELNIYSYRSPTLLQPLLDAYTAETGTRFNIVHSPKGLAQRLKAEGAGSPADLVLTEDISRLAALKDMGLLAPIGSAIIKSRVPNYLRDGDDEWVALSTRARVVAVSRRRVADADLPRRMEDLANPEWRGRICTRVGSHVYNRALLASLIAHLGAEEAETWARGLVANLARKPQGNDRAQAQAINAGRCDIALMNTYYYGLMANNTAQPEQRDWAAAIRIVFTNQGEGDRGQHVNISGGGIVATSRRKPEARAFLEWLTGETAQRLYAEINYEYPVNPAVVADGGLGAFRADTLPINALAVNTPEAQRIIDRVGW